MMSDDPDAGDVRAQAAAMVKAIIEEGGYQVPDRVRDVVEQAITQDLILVALLGSHGRAPGTH